MLCTKSNRSPQIRNVFNQNLFILLLTCFNIFRMKVFLACKHLVVFYLSLKVAINFSSLRNFPEPIFLKVLANEDTLLRTHCCRHKCFPVCPRAQHLLRTQILCPGHKNVSDFVQKHFVSATNVSQFAQPKKHHGQQCVRNNVSSFTRAFTFSCGPRLLRSVTFILPLLWSFYLCHTKHATIISWHDDPRSINSKFNGQNQNF